MQSLAAKHGIALNRIAKSVLVTSRRGLAKNVLAGADGGIMPLDGERPSPRPKAATTIFTGYQNAAGGSGFRPPPTAVKEAIKAQPTRLRGAAAS